MAKKVQLEGYCTECDTTDESGPVRETLIRYLSVGYHIVILGHPQEETVLDYHLQQESKNHGYHTLYLHWVCQYQYRKSYDSENTWI